MCGVFGAIWNAEGDFPQALMQRAVEQLSRGAEERGKDSSGLVVYPTWGREVYVLKGNLRISELLRAQEARRLLAKGIKGYGLAQQGSLTVMGHSRLVTNGSQLNPANNQPVVTAELIGIHNGIIVNDVQLWETHKDLKRKREIDTEVLLALTEKELRAGCPWPDAIAKVGSLIEGTYSVAILAPALQQLALASNNGSLYALTNEKDYLAFGSEKWHMEHFWAILPKELRETSSFTHVRGGVCIVVSLEHFSIQTGFDKIPCERAEVQSACIEHDKLRERQKVTIVESMVAGKQPRQELVLDTMLLARAPSAGREAALLEFPVERVRKLRRCTRCVLPETFPFISFDAQGVCNYCRGYRLKNQPKPFEELVSLVAPYRRSDERPDCIVPFSGGRDSSYALHVIKNELGLNPIAFTYDWGMVTDLARRNIARVCGKLGIENIIVAADIYRKRDNIRRNVLAWLDRPHLGMVPLFMAGDKYFYYHVNRVARRTGIRLNIWGINPLENTDFKVGFLGIPPDFKKRHIYSLSVARQAKLFLALAKAVRQNPGYLNRSLLNSIGGFISRSILPHTDYYHLYDYVRWDEEAIEKVLFGYYNWERACDTATTWRIGDGTAAFYNYIYYTVAGFSEHDTFRSNQIREGQLERSTALDLVERDNYPRYPTIKWYLSILGLDFERTIRRINEIPRLYER